MVQNKKITRRSFLGRTAGGVAGGFVFPAIVPSSALGLDGRPSPSNRVAMGSIGVGPQGSGVMGNFLSRPEAQVVAVCDVKRWVREGAKKKVDDFYGGTGCAEYADFRELLARPDIDAVTVATPDHWHVLAALAAVRAGKSVYVEKPLGVSVAEDQALRRAVREHGVKFQFGTQQRSGDQFRRACELAINGYIGELKEINVWAPGSSSGGSLEPCRAPDGLDYEMWIGPAPMVPHTANRCENSLWWFNSDYAVGFIAGWGIHPIDIAWWGGGKALDGPVEVSGTGVFPRDGFCNTATNWDVKLRYQRSGVSINFTGLPQRPEWDARYRQTTGHGTAFEGTEGWVHVDRSHINVSDEKLLKVKFRDSDIRLRRSRHHAGNLLECVLRGGETVCPVEESVQSDIMCHISDVAIRLMRPVTWEPVSERFVNDDEANRMLSRSMRSPWRL